MNEWMEQIEDEQHAVEEQREKREKRNWNWGF